MTEWQKTNKRQPCLICGKPDWCTRTEGGSCCMRIVSAKPMKNGGWFHVDGDAVAPVAYQRPAKVHEGKPPVSIDWTALSRDYEAALSTADLMRLATNLGVSYQALKRLRVGSDGEAFTFPMCNSDHEIVGIRRRLPDGKKLSVKGGREGIFWPDGVPGDLATTMVITEGPSDCAAALDADCDAVGRPNCTGGVDIIKSITRRMDVVICADMDGPGKDGAVKLATAIARPGRIVKIVYPAKGKDMREWHPTGFSMACVIQAASPFRVTL